MSIDDNASSPKRVSNASESAEQHSLAEQDAHLRFKMATRARSNCRAAGVNFVKLVPHGAVLPARDTTDGVRGPLGL